MLALPFHSVPCRTLLSIHLFSASTFCLLFPFLSLYVFPLPILPPSFPSFSQKTNGKYTQNHWNAHCNRRTPWSSVGWYQLQFSLFWGFAFWAGQSPAHFQYVLVLRLLFWNYLPSNRIGSNLNYCHGSLSLYSFEELSWQKPYLHR